MCRIIFTLVAIGVLSGCGSSKREDPNFRMSHRASAMMSCDNGEFSTTTLHGGTPGNAVFHLNDTYSQLDYIVSVPGEVNESVTLKLLPNNADEMLETHFIAFEWTQGLDGSFHTGNMVGELFNIDFAYWVMVDEYSATLSDKAEEGYDYIGFTLLNNTLVLMFEREIQGENGLEVQQEDVPLGIHFYLSTLVADSTFADETSIWAPCSNTTYPWE